jgi:hypothetical protein
VFDGKLVLGQMRCADPDVSDAIWPPFILFETQFDRKKEVTMACKVL